MLLRALARKIFRLEWDLQKLTCQQEFCQQKSLQYVNFQHILRAFLRDFLNLRSKLLFRGYLSKSCFLYLCIFNNFSISCVYQRAILVRHLRLARKPEQGMSMFRDEIKRMLECYFYQNLYSYKLEKYKVSLGVALEWDSQQINYQVVR